MLQVPGNSEQIYNSFDQSSQLSNYNLGRINIGWTIGEEILFDGTQQARTETCYSETESCLLGINKNKLAMLQKELLDKNNTKDYYVLESVLKGNYLLKTNWRNELQSNPSQYQFGNNS